MLSFSYDIVPGGQRQGAPLTHGNPYIADLESPKRYVQRVNVRNLDAQSYLEVILRDPLGNEIWRGRYLRSSNA
jgi:hypothetical protein